MRWLWLVALVMAGCLQTSSPEPESEAPFQPEARVFDARELRFHHEASGEDFCVLEACYRGADERHIVLLANESLQSMHMVLGRSGGPEATWRVACVGQRDGPCSGEILAKARGTGDLELVLEDAVTVPGARLVFRFESHGPLPYTQFEVARAQGTLGVRLHPEIVLEERVVRVDLGWEGVTGVCGEPSEVPCGNYPSRFRHVLQGDLQAIHMEFEWEAQTAHTAELQARAWCVNWAGRPAPGCAESTHREVRGESVLLLETEGLGAKSEGVLEFLVTAPAIEPFGDMVLHQPYRATGWLEELRLVRVI